jgi:integrase
VSKQKTTPPRKTAPARKRRARRQQHDIEELQRQAEAYAANALADRTRAVYEEQWAAFSTWCFDHGRVELPATPDTISAYLTARAQLGCSVPTMAIELSAIAYYHHQDGHPKPLGHPVVGNTWAGIRRRLGKPPTQKAPATTALIRKMVAALPPGLMGVRDRALLTLGYAGGFRRAELVALDRADLQFTPEVGLVVTVRRSKTDQEGRGLVKVISRGRQTATCPVTAVEDWLELAGITAGPVFRAVDRHGNVATSPLSDQTVARVVKRTLRAAGIPEAQYSGHSLRAGLVTEAKLRGVEDAKIMRVTGHRSLQTMHGYDRRLELLKDPVSGKLGL